LSQIVEHRHPYPGQGGHTGPVFAIGNAINHVIAKLWKVRPTLRRSRYIGAGDVRPMSTKRNTVPALQRELLIAGISRPNGRLKFAKGSAETLATTYAALLSLQRKKLIEPEKQADPCMMSWRVTKAGKAAVAEKSGRR
jgi:hypothetical protein